MKKINLKTCLITCLFVIFVIFTIAPGISSASQQNLEQKIDTMLNVLAPHSDAKWQRENKKDSIRRVLTRDIEISGNPLVDELLNDVLNSRTEGEITRPVQDSDIEQIIDIINPDVDTRERRRHRNIIIQILNSTYNGEEPVNKGKKGGAVIKGGSTRALVSLARVTVSDQIGSRFKGANAIDGIENTEWAARGSRGKWLLLKWKNPVNIKSIGLLGRRQDISVHIRSSDIIFSDGTIIEFGALDAARFRKISVDKKSITWIKYYIREGVNNVGLSEIEVSGSISSVQSKGKKTGQKLFAANLAQKAAVQVSSALNNNHSGKRAVDRNPLTEWVAKGGADQWILLSWKSAVQINRVRLKGRTGDSASRIDEAFLVFSDGAVVWIDGGLGANKTKTLKTRHKKVTWLKLYIRRGRHKAGLAEIEVTGKSIGKRIIAANLAQGATARVSDSAGRKYRAGFVKDRSIETQWVANGARDRWVSLEWDEPVTIGTLSLSAGNGLQNGRILDSVLILSDGSLIPVGAIKPGQTKTLKVNKPEMWWIKFFVRKGHGKIGISEIVVKER